MRLWLQHTYYISMVQMYHGCMTKNADGLNKLIGPGEKCLTPTANCFWKNAEDIKSCGITTRSQTKIHPIVSIKDYNYYFQNKERTNR